VSNVKGKQLIYEDLSGYIPVATIKSLADVDGGYVKK
jgi:hypothetical protein